MTTVMNGIAGASTDRAMRAIRTGLRFARRCWTGEDLTWATAIVGIVLFLGLLWLIETLVSSSARAIGILDPAGTLAGWTAVAAYVVLGYAHDRRAVRRQTTHRQSRIRTEAFVRSFGVERLVTEQGGVVATDVDGIGNRRRLWCFEDRHASVRVVAVEVLNSTPERDGARRSYFLRVPPDTRTCQAAVAWTFGLVPSDYEPLIET